MKTFRQIVLEVRNDAVIEAALRLYRETENKWLPEAIGDALDELRRLVPAPAGSAYELHIARAEIIDPREEPFWEVFCRKENDAERYGLDLSPWEEWLAVRVPPPLLDEMPGSEIVAHCLWEMTFYGFTQEAVAENRAELDRRMREFDEGKVKGIPWEEVKERLREELESLKSDSSDCS